MTDERRSDLLKQCLEIIKTFKLRLVNVEERCKFLETEHEHVQDRVRDVEERLNEHADDGEIEVDVDDGWL